MARPFGSRPAMASAASNPSTTTTTMILQEDPSPSQPHPLQQPPQSQTLVLRLTRPKKKVTWKEGTVDNEFLHRKSSKKCCVFHKQKPFDEDSSDDEDDGHGEDHHHQHSGKCPKDGGAGSSGCSPSSSCSSSEGR